MTVSVRLDPVLELRLREEARRLGITQSAYITQSLERSLGHRNPAELLRQIRSGAKVGRSDLSENVSALMKARMREKHSG